MPLQNRVTPFGELAAVESRGTIMGNRGVIHDGARRIVRRWANPHWITCVLEYKDHHRVVMTPGRWTELFFLDEPTALAAGHRPCFFCRHGEAVRFAEAWAAGQGRAGERPKVAGMDALLHEERIAQPGGGKRIHPLPSGALPDGAMVGTDGGEGAWLAWGDRLWRWSFEGYADTPPAAGTHLALLTPPSTVAALAAGYRPRPPAGMPDHS